MGHLAKNAGAVKPLPSVVSDADAGCFGIQAGLTFRDENPDGRCDTIGRKKIGNEGLPAEKLAMHVGSPAQGVGGLVHVAFAAGRGGVHSGPASGQHGHPGLGIHPLAGSRLIKILEIGNMRLARPGGPKSIHHDAVNRQDLFALHVRLQDIKAALQRRGPTALLGPHHGGHAECIRFDVMQCLAPGRIILEVNARLELGVSRQRRREVLG